MAKFEVSAFETSISEYISAVAKMPEVIPAMIDAGAEVMRAALADEAAALNATGRATGGLANSIKIGKLQAEPTGQFREVYPDGTAKNGKRYAEEGFVLEYGRSNMEARPWMSAAVEKSESAVIAAEMKVWEGAIGGDG